MLIIIYFRFCVSIVYASIEIHDLNNNPIAIVPLGKAKLKIGHIRIIQPINYAQFIETIDNFDILIKKKAYNTQLYKLLQTKYNMLYQTYLKISPTRNRSKRWNTIGTIWKWIAGTPDADDLRIINNTMNSLIEENNQQVYINQAADARLQHISNITNELMELNFKTEQQHLVNINLLTILLNVDIIQHQIEVLEDAILPINAYLSHLQKHRFEEIAFLNFPLFYDYPILVLSMLHYFTFIVCYTMQPLL